MGKKKVTKYRSFIQWHFYCRTLNALENIANLNYNKLSKQFYNHFSAIQKKYIFIVPDTGALKILNTKLPPLIVQ